MNTILNVFAGGGEGLHTAGFEKTVRKVLCSCKLVFRSLPNDFTFEHLKTIF